MKIKFSQIAICIPNVAKHFKVLQDVTKVFGEQSYTDSLRMQGMVKHDEVDVDLILSFYHNLFYPAIEVEYITSASMEHWHVDIAHQNGNRPFLSHFGAYLEYDEFDDTERELTKLGFTKLQDTQSYDHSNKREAGEPDRHYQDIIFDSAQTLGFNIKLTRKIK